MTIYDWRTIGGGVADQPGMLPETLIKEGWTRYAERLVESVDRFGAPGGLILHNPGGIWPQRKPDGTTIERSMRWDQFTVAQSWFGDGFEYWDIYRAVKTLRSVTTDVWFYLGWLRYQTPDLSKIEDAVRPIINAGAGIIIDSAGSEDANGKVLHAGSDFTSRTPAYAVATLMRSQGVRVGYEPRPNIGSPFADRDDMLCVSLLKQDGTGWYRTSPARHGDAASIYVADEDIRGGYALLCPMDGPTLDDIRRSIHWAAGVHAEGHPIGVHGGTLWGHLQMTAQDVEQMAAVHSEGTG